jgi:hypothetical protein
MLPDRQLDLFAAAGFPAGPVVPAAPRPSGVSARDLTVVLLVVPPENISMPPPLLTVVLVVVPPPAGRIRSRRCAALPTPG